MMRNIEFRGLAKSGWIYGYVHTDEYNSDVVRIQQKESCSDVDCIYQSVNVDAKTVGRYIGIEDKDGVKIFDDDIVIYGDYSNGAYLTRPQPKRKHIIKFNDKYGCYELPGAGFHPDWSKVKVIGNIHENPELLEQ